MAALVTSAVLIEGADGSRTTVGVHGGFLQVVNNEVTLLTDRAQVATDREAAATMAKELAQQ
jgi:F0F1-type ATP synthase epsilon subunit